ncbi:hypothetical protein D3C72_898100 [compost metagenome]
MAESVSPRTTSWYWAGGAAGATRLLSTLVTLATLPAASAAFSLASCEGAWPARVTTPLLAV